MKGVTVILPTYNGVSRGYLESAIQSVLSQTYAPIELIIVDDGSTDKTKNLCNKYTVNPTVRYVYQSNKGLSGARNTGIRNAKYDYLCFLDDDDLYEPQMVETLYRTWQEYSGSKLGMVYCGVSEINEEGDFLCNRVLKISGDIYGDLFWGNFISAPSATMVHKSVLEEVEPFDEELLSCEDYDMWLKISKKYEILPVEEYLTRYRVHQNKMSINFEKMQFFHRKVLDRALENAPDHILRMKQDYYHYFYQCCAAQYLGNEMFPEFRSRYRQASSYGQLKFIWKIKYYLSHLPKLFLFLKYVYGSVKWVKN